MTFKSKLPITIRMTDLDPFGHVNNGVYYSYYDIGRFHYLSQIKEDIRWAVLDKVIVRIECDFKAPILYGDDISVETKVIEIGNRSVKMMQRIVDNNTGNVKSTCIAILCGYDRQNNTSKEISQDFKDRVKTFEEN
ncbi:MAG: acyl-CoA thioesterase [Bacteroidetes bacterium]|nr:acyl-CoA thioesterase [Bacteroidota bacterium]